MDSPALRTLAETLFFGLAGMALCWATPAFAASQEFGGIGLQVVPVSTGELTVLKVVKNTPAASAGLRPGDLIIEVDRFVLRGSDFKEIVSSKLWGRPGSPVSIRYLRPGEKGVRQSVLRRVPMEPRTKDLPGVKMITPSLKSSEGGS